MPQATQPLTGFILKKEACSTYDRSFRQLSRDFAKALQRGDLPFLSNFKLRLEDGTILESSEVTNDRIQQLRDKGLNPTWFVREAWMQKLYGLRGDPPSVHEQPSPNSGLDLPQEPGDASTQIPPPLLKSKDDLIDILREENKFLRDALRREQDRTTEDRQLTRELHVLLKNMQDRLLPGATVNPMIDMRAQTNAAPATPPPTPEPSPPSRTKATDAPAKPKRPPAVKKPRSIWTTDVTELLPRLFKSRR